MRKFLSHYGDTIFIVTMIGAFAVAGVLVLNQHAISMSGWETDFNIRDVPLGDFVSVHERDAVAPIDTPLLVKPNQVKWLSAKSPVIAVEIDGEARAYPLAVMVYHEVVNDEIQGVPIAVTYCPLCNSAIVYDRRVNDATLRFGVAGAVRNNGFIMWDDLTQSWWQQFTGKAIMGAYTGTMLDILPAKVVSFGAFVSYYADGRVLVGDANDSGYNYSTSPMAGYDSRPQPEYGDEPVDARLPAMERVLGAVIAGQPVVYPFSVLAKERVVNDTVQNMAVVAFWQPGAVSPLDNVSIDKSRDVGMAVLFYRQVNGLTLTFYNDNGVIKDRETHSTWSIFGKAMDGELKGTRLDQTDCYPNFWFAWSSAYPNTGVYTG